jgi:dTDP-4-amino-4,6-dideoxygalactose transaminase
VNYGGVLGDVEEYQAIAEEFGLKLIYDGAHCLHTAYRHSLDAPWIPIGALDAPVCYSFYASKCITTGEGGMVTTNDAALAARLRRVSFHGITPPAETGGTGMNWDYDIAERGYKANLNDVLAALGLSQLSRGWEFHEQRRSIVSFYQRELRGNIPADVPEEPANRQSSWHIFPLLLRLEELTLSRDEILLQLRDLSVHCSVQWRPLHHFSLYKALAREGKARFGRLPVTDEIFSRMLTLPISPAHSQDEISRVVEALKCVLGAATRNRNKWNHLREAM